MCDPATVYHEEPRTARKAHRCEECGITIAPGDRYVHVSGLWDGGWSHYAFCPTCREASAILWSFFLDSQGGPDCIAFGELWATVDEEIRLCDLTRLPANGDPAAIGAIIGKVYARALEMA